MKIRIAGIANDSIVDGQGLRMTVFTQGCPHRCPGCHNPETHDPDGGNETTTEEIIEQMKKNPLLTGITISGGEPMMQPKACLELAKAAHQEGLDVWLYTGYTWQELLADPNPDKMALLWETDVLVEGRYVKSLRSLNLRFRGSSNQRIIDLRKTKANHKLTLWEE